MGFKIVLTSVSGGSGIKSPSQEAARAHAEKIEILQFDGWEIGDTKLAFSEHGSITYFMTTAERKKND